MTDSQSGTPEGQPGLVPAALFGLCPRCGARCLFDGVAAFAPRCRVCALDFAGFNVGDGPAAFLTLIIGALITGLALWLELAWHPPFWLHSVLGVPRPARAVVGGLRVGRAAPRAAKSQRRAGEAGAKDLHEP